MVRMTLIAAMLLLVACKSDPVALQFSGETMGTTYNVTAIDKTADLDADDVQAAVDATLAEVNATMSNWDPSSEISQFNAHTGTDPVGISKELAIVMRAAEDVHVKSFGQFDVTLGPLIELWGFGARTSESPIPADDAIAAAMEKVGQTKILSLTDAPTMAKSRPETSVYLAAIAKGYGVDAIGATLEGLGMTDYLVEIGGDLLTSGKTLEGNDWRIGIERPDAAARTIEEVVSISGWGMATSGDYRNYFEEDGVRYSHIIDAETGRPITHLTASVTVLTENAMLADAWATALLVLGAERGVKVAEDHGLAALFISRDPDAASLSFTTSSSSAFAALQATE